MRKLFLFLLLLIGLHMYACINIFDYKLNKRPTFDYTNETYRMFIDEQRHLLQYVKEYGINRVEEIKIAEKFYNENHKKWTLPKISDYAALLIKTGKYNKAEKILDTLIEAYPKDYTINANMGTLYELQGKPEKAHKLISKAVALNPASHDSSEWIHVKILEAKIRIKKDPKWLQKNSLLGIDFGTDSLPNSTNKSQLHRNYIRHLVYQLEERTFFVAPKDDIVADMFYNLGCIFIATDYGMISGKELLKLSIEYSNLRKTHAQKIIAYIDHHYPKHYLDEYAEARKNSEKSVSERKDLKKTADEYPEKDKSNSNQAKKTFPFVVPPVLIVVILVAARKRRLRRKQQE